MAVKKPRKKPELRPIPPDDVLPDPTGPATTGPGIDAVVLAVDPAETSGWAVLDVGADGSVEIVASGTVDLYAPPADGPVSVEGVVALAADEARARGKVLTAAIEHSKNAYGGSAFGVGGFIAMLRAQGVWLRAYEVAIRIANSGSITRVGRRQVFKSGNLALVEANVWRDGVFGTRRYVDPASKKSFFLQRHHWKHLAVGAVASLFGLDASPDQAEAVLIGLWASRRGRV